MDWLRSQVVRSESPAVQVPIMPPHPFYPKTLVLSNYTANDREMSLMVVGFLAGWVPILGVTWWLTTRFSPHLHTQDRLIVMWFVLTATIHTFFEGYFVYNNATFGAKQNLLAQLWKEYALADSRYVSADPVVVCAEGITAILWGPLSYLTAIYIGIRHPMRYPLQAIVSLGQMYGDLLYMATSIMDLWVRDLSYSRPEPYYFWFYFIFLNGIWIVIPGFLLWQSSAITGKAFKALARLERSLAKTSMNSQPRGNGHVTIDDYANANAMRKQTDMPMTMPNREGDQDTSQGRLMNMNTSTCGRHTGLAA